MQVVDLPEVIAADGKRDCQSEQPGFAEKSPEEQLPIINPSFVQKLGPDHRTRQSQEIFWTFVSEELPRFVRSMSPRADRRKDNFVAGISLSEVLDIVAVMRKRIHLVFDVDEYFGGFGRLTGSRSDLFAQLGKLKKKGIPISRLYIACGLDDELYNMNIKFRDFAPKILFRFPVRRVLGDYVGLLGSMYLPGFGLAHATKGWNMRLQ